jgi:hypothetical protein
MGDTRASDALDYHLVTADALNLPVTVRMLQRRPAHRVDRWEEG